MISRKEGKEIQIPVCTLNCSFQRENSWNQISLGHLSLRVPQLEVEGKWNLTAHSANGVIYGLVTVFVTDVSKLVWLVCSGKCFNKRVRFHIPNRTCELFLDRLWLEYSQMNNICIHCCHKFASKTLWYFHAPNASFAPYVL